MTPLLFKLFTTLPRLSQTDVVDPEIGSRGSGLRGKRQKIDQMSAAPKLNEGDLFVDMVERQTKRFGIETD
jgi:hypothetical protein